MLNFLTLLLEMADVIRCRKKFGTKCRFRKDFFPNSAKAGILEAKAAPIHCLSLMLMEVLECISKKE